MISESTNSEAEPENSVKIGSSDTQPQNSASDSDDADRSVSLLHSLKLSDTIWRHKSGSTLAQVMACCLLGTKPLWHWRKWKSWPTSKRDPRPRYRPTGKCPLYRYEATGQLLHSEVGSNQVGCSCTWQRSLSCETSTGATEKVPAPNQSWRGCNHPTLNWPYQGHQIPYLVPRTTDWLSPLWSNTDHWPYAAAVCTVTGMSWWILHSRLVECSLRDNSWDLHSGIPARSGILLSDMM